MELQGSVGAGFGGVREVFDDVVAAQPGSGASFAVWHDGEWVVDLWGGYADASHKRPWRRDTLVMPYSVTKPFAAVCLLMLVDRGRVDLDTPMQEYWPELRAPASVRDLLSHRAGLVVLDVDAPVEAFYDWDLMCSLLARQEPVWAPGTAQGESALFYGHLVGQVVRAVDHRSVGQFLRDEVCGPQGLDFHIGLTDEELPRTADLTGFDATFHAAQKSGSELYRRAIGNPPGALDPAVLNSERWRRAEVPAINGHGTARAVAAFYQALAHERLVSADLLKEMTRRRGAEPELVMGGEREWGLGLALEPDGYGMGGLGGSFGFWSEEGRYAIAFLTGHIGDYERADRLDAAVRQVLGLDPL